MLLKASASELGFPASQMERRRPFDGVSAIFGLTSGPVLPLPLAPLAGITGAISRRSECVRING